MAGNFDPYDKDSWYFGPLSRSEANNLLMMENETGVFLVRNSSSIQGDLVLCVREDNKVSHYIINKIQQSDQTRFRIGDQQFPDVPALLSFYKRHYLDTTHLMRPASKRVEKVRAMHHFEGSDADDLPFRKGDVLTVIAKDEEQWWTARNKAGKSGSIPVNYVVLIDDENGAEPHEIGRNGSPVQDDFLPAHLPSQPQTHPKAAPAEPIKYNTPSIQRKTPQLPALAKVRQARVPNAYDKTALKLQVGDIIKVTQTNINGQWEGELNGKTGHFPFTHVDFIDAENGDDDQAV